MRSSAVFSFSSKLCQLIFVTLFVSQFITNLATPYGLFGGSGDNDDGGKLVVGLSSLGGRSASQQEPAALKNKTKTRQVITGRNKTHVGLLETTRLNKKGHYKNAHATQYSEADGLGFPLDKIYDEDNFTMIETENHPNDLVAPASKKVSSVPSTVGSKSHSPSAVAKPLQVATEAPLVADVASAPLQAAADAPVQAPSSADANSQNQPPPGTEAPVAPDASAPALQAATEAPSSAAEKSPSQSQNEAAAPAQQAATEAPSAA